MSWVCVGATWRWIGETFPEPSDEELSGYEADAEDAELVPLKRHGSKATAQRHRRRGEKPCALCRMAERDYDREQKAKYRERARAKAKVARQREELLDAAV